MTQRLLAAMNRRIAGLPEKSRLFSEEIGTLPRAFVLTGPRGVGKSTFLLRRARGRRMLYCSADNPLIANIPLYELGNSVFIQGYEGLIVDEVHFAKDWSSHIKALYDDFPDRSIWVSDSSSLVLRSGNADLSRRFVPIAMPLLSFREYVALRAGLRFDVFDPFESVPIQPTADILALFAEYRQQGTRPFFHEGSYPERMLAVLEKTLYADIPFFMPNITEGNLRLMNAIVGTLAAAAIPRLHVRSLCADWGIGAERLYQILFVMESIGVLRILRKERDTKARTVGEKLFFGDPTLYAVLGGNLGTAREALAAAMLAEGGRIIESAADETSGDFIVDRKISIEIGGASKVPKKSDYVVRDDIDHPAGKALPLWSLGFLY